MSRALHGNNRAWPVGTPVSVCWKDGRTYDAVVIEAPDGQKISAAGRVCVQFTECGEWDIVRAEDVSRAASSRPRKMHRRLAPVTSTQIATERVLACIAKEWQTQAAVHDLVRLAYATEGHGHTLHSTILASPMSPVVAQAYEVVRRNGDPRGLLDVLRELSQRDAAVEAGRPEAPGRARAKRSRCIKSSSGSEDESDSGSEDEGSSSGSEDEEDVSMYDTGSGVTPHMAERLARILSTRVTSGVQHNRARDAYAEIYVAMGCTMVTPLGNALQAHYAALLLESEGAPTKWLMSEAKIVQALRRAESREELRWVEDTQPRSGVVGAVSPVLRNVQGAYYVLERAVLDMTNALRGDIPAARWGLLTHVDFEVSRELTRHPHAHDHCEACDKTRPVTSRFHWSCYDEQRREWSTGSDCAGRILAARQAHAFTDRVVQAAQGPVDADTEKQLLEEWRKVYDEITKLAC